MKRKKMTRRGVSPLWVQEEWSRSTLEALAENAALKDLSMGAPTAFEKEKYLRDCCSADSETETRQDILEGPRKVNAKALSRRRKAKRLARKSRQRNR